MKINDKILMQYAEDLLSKDEKIKVDQEIKKNPKLLIKIESFKKVNETLDKNYGPLYDEPVPQNFLKKLGKEKIGIKNTFLFTVLNRATYIASGAVLAILTFIYMPFISFEKNFLKDKSLDPVIYKHLKNKNEKNKVESQIGSYDDNFFNKYKKELANVIERTADNKTNTLIIENNLKLYIKPTDTYYKKEETRCRIVEYKDSAEPTDIGAVLIEACKDLRKPIDAKDAWDINLIGHRYFPR